MNKIDKNIPALDEFVFPDSTSELMCFLPKFACTGIILRFSALCFIVLSRYCFFIFYKSKVRLRLVEGSDDG